MLAMCHVPYMVLCERSLGAINETKLRRVCCRPYITVMELSTPISLLTVFCIIDYKPSRSFL